jgi:hypothetical protein
MHSGASRRPTDRAGLGRTWNYDMLWDVEYTDEFGEWWRELDQDEQDAIDRSVGLLKIGDNSWILAYF